MAKLTKIIIPATLAALATIATPAMASPAIHQDKHYDARSHNSGYNNNQSNRQANALHRDLQQLDQRIDRAFNKRQIANREANNLRKDVRNVQRDLRQAERGGLSRNEARTIENRIARVDRELQKDIRDNNKWSGRRG